MKNVFLVGTAVILLFSLRPLRVYGRVGETLSECMTRYGEPTPRLKNDEATLVRFKQGEDIQIQCYFDGEGNDATCEAMHVSKGLGAILELDQINKILEGNKGNSQWEEPATEATQLGVQRNWRTTDRTLVASSLLGGLSIQTTERRDREEAKRKNKLEQEVSNLGAVSPGPPATQTEPRPLATEELAHNAIDRLKAEADFRSLLQERHVLAKQDNGSLFWHLRQERLKADEEKRPCFINEKDPRFDAWFLVYRRLREFFPRNRRNPTREVVLPILENDSGLHGKRFPEAEVLAAMAGAYKEDFAGHERRLLDAYDELISYGLLTTIIGEDLCQAVLDAGMPGIIGDRVADTIKKGYGKLGVIQQTPRRHWLLSSIAMHEGNHRDASEACKKGYKKLQNAGPIDPIDHPLLGGQAFFLLTYDSANAAKAKTVLKRATEASECFEIVRARAALAAAEGDWGNAVKLIADCADMCPAALKDDIQVQRDAYASKTAWRIGEKSSANKSMAKDGESDRPQRIRNELE